jgi:hypothetical protein
MSEPRERPIIMAGDSVAALFLGVKTQTRRLMNPQPQHLQHHEWKGKLVYEGEHRMWCWKQHTYENLWDEHIRDPDRQHLATMCPLGVAGDRLWVRESWRSWRRTCVQDGDHQDDPDAQCSTHCDQTYVAYRATPRVGYRPVPDKQRITYLDESSPLEQDPRVLGPWKPSIHMPRPFSRISLEITGVRVERLQEITEADAQLEGVTWTDYGPGRPGWHYGKSTSSDQCHHSAKMAYGAVWNRLHGGPGWNLKSGPSPWDLNPFVWATSFKVCQP